MIYLDIKEQEERRQFLEQALAISGATLKEYPAGDPGAFTKEELIESRYPIAVDPETLKIDYIRSNLGAAGVASKGEMLTAEEGLALLRKNQIERTVVHD